LKRKTSHFFDEKRQKIAENCGHNIDPRLSKNTNLNLRTDPMFNCAKDDPRMSKQKKRYK
jgi:hypothetical protein